MKLCSCGVTEARRAGARKHQAFVWGEVFDAVDDSHGHGVVRSKLNRFEWMTSSKCWRHASVHECCFRLQTHGKSVWPESSRKWQSGMDWLAPSKQQNFSSVVELWYKIFGSIQLSCIFWAALKGHGFQLLAFRLGSEGRNPCQGAWYSRKLMKATGVPWVFISVFNQPFKKINR